MSSGSIIPENLIKYRKEILTDRMKEQPAASIHRGDLMSEADLQAPFKAAGLRTMHSRKR